MEKRIDIWITLQGSVAQNVLHAISMAALTSSDFDFAEEDGRLIYSESGVEKVSNVIREDMQIKDLFKKDINRHNEGVIKGLFNG